MVVSNINLPTGQATLEALSMTDDGSVNAEPMWTPGKEIDPSGFRVTVDGTLVDVLTAIVDEFGQSIALTFPSAVALATIEVIAGHPAMVGANGMVCGGTIKAS